MVYKEFWSMARFKILATNLIYVVKWFIFVTVLVITSVLRWFFVTNTSKQFYFSTVRDNQSLRNVFFSTHTVLSHGMFYHFGHQSNIICSQMVQFCHCFGHNFWSEMNYLVTNTSKQIYFITNSDNQLLTTFSMVYTEFWAMAHFIILVQNLIYVAKWFIFVTVLVITSDLRWIIW